MVANIRGYTPNYNFKLVNFDTPRWHTLEYANWSQVDAMFLQLGTPPVRGEWQNSIQYVVGDRVFEAETSQLYRCLVTHTSAATGTFVADRLANPSYWTIQILGVPLFRGDWLAGAVYALGDIVVTGNYHYHLCVVSHTSSTTFPPDDAFWETVFDATNVVLDAEAAATNAANSAAAAAASAAEAAASADEAEQAASLAVTAQSAFRWNFDASTVAADPGMGEVRFNNATLINITQLMLSAQSADFGNPNVSGWVITWDDSTNLTSRGSIYVRNAASPENFLVFDVNGPVVDNGTWQSVTVKYIAHGGTLADGDNLAVAFTRTGNAGTSGSGAGDMLSTNNLSDVADPVAAADNIGVGPTDTPSFVQVVLSSPATIPNHATRKEYVDSAGAALQASIDTKAPLASPALTGNPTAPTPTAGDNDTSIATTQFVTTADAAVTTAYQSADSALAASINASKADKTYVDSQDALKAPIASPTFTGDPKAPTPSAGDNDTTIATTAFVANAVQSKVDKTGDTMTGDLIVSKLNPYVAVNKTASGQNAAIVGQTNGAGRWGVFLGDSSAESGSNVGSNFGIYRYDDAGNPLGVPFTINRANGQTAFAQQINAGNGIAVTGSLSASASVYGVTGVGIGAPGYNLLSGDASFSNILHDVQTFWQYNRATGTNIWSVNNVAQLYIWYGQPYTLQIIQGALKPGGGPWTDTSDIRIKNVKGEYKHGLDDVVQLRPVLYTFKGNDTPEPPAHIKSPNEQTPENKEPVVVPYPNSPHKVVAERQTQYIGLIAQEVEPIFPGMVTKRNGYIDGEATDILDLDTSPLIFALINAVKELKARVEALEAGV